MIVGTSGHIDHGKTSLIRRLTGKDTDRLPEEKRRGISIELGYAYLGLDPQAMPADHATSGASPAIGFIDVPGHEKFVHAMVSGASGIDYALLVIAADDGPMPQTREHLEILRLLGVDRGAVVLTKIDAVDSAVADMAVASIADALAGQPASHWPLFPVSSTTGDGIDALRDHLLQQAQQWAARSRSGHFRLSVDRSFTLSGIGTVVTGTAHAGQVQVGDEVMVVSSDPMASTARARVRSIHAQDQPSNIGHAGQRLALNLVGLSVQEVPRGSWVNAVALSNATQRVDIALGVSVAHERAIAQGLEVHLHHGSHDAMARIYPLNVDRAEPGSACFASVVLSQPMAICRGDRVVLRDSQARTTLGGGVVVDTSPPLRGKRTPARLRLLQALRDDSLVDAMIALAASAPVSMARLAQGWNLTDQELVDLVAQAGLPRAGDVVFHPQRWDEIHARLMQATDDTHQREPEMPGIEQNRLRRVAAPALDKDVFAEMVDALIANGAIVRRGAFLARPTHKAELSQAERNLWASIRPLLEESPYNPPRVRDIAKLTHIPEAEIRANLRRVARIGEVMLVALDHFFVVQRVAEMAQIAQALFDQHGTIRAAEFRDRIGGGRKVAIQILEFFDRVGYTRRLRDEHLIRQANPFAASLEPAQPEM